MQRPQAQRLPATPRRRRCVRRLLALTVGASVALAGCGAGPERMAPTTGIASMPVGTSVPASPTPAPTSDGHEAAVAAFVDAATSGDWSYRVKFVGQVAASADVLPIAGTLDVAGRDFTNSFTYDFEPEYPGQGVGKKKVQVRGVEDEGWIKRGGGAWTSIKRYGAEDSSVPFKAVKTVEDVRYVGPAEIDGKPVHRISIPGSLLINPNTIPYQSQKEEVDQTTLEVLIDDKGRPRIGTWHLVGKARVGEGVGQLQRLVYDLDLTFTKVGDDITVKRP